MSRAEGESVEAPQAPRVEFGEGCPLFRGSGEGALDFFLIVCLGMAGM